MPTPAEYTELPVRITRDAIYFGDEKVPGCIAADGVTLKPGGSDDINRLTVTFLVGAVTAEDPFVTAAEVITPAQTVTQYESSRQ